ncbi:hypothetical protein BD779DRAFT_1548580 [Infundibulicybe gibba]|nr:hypothetical protein BD779DRAFT_1548580 [Infundibulicybe gibba]
MDDYIIHPQLAPGFSGCEAPDSVMYLRVDLHTTPVLLVGVGTETAINNASARAAADNQTRLRLGQLSDEHSTELHGISALGTRLRFYCCDRAESVVTSPPILQHTTSTNDVAPADLWDTDLLTDSGYGRFMDFLAHVMTLAAAEGAWPSLLV